MKTPVLVLIAAIALGNGAQVARAEGDCGTPRRGRRCTTAPLRPGLGKVEAWKQLGSDERIEVPIAYHVVRMVGEPALPEELLELQTEALNRAFVNTRISFRTASVHQPRYAWRPPIFASCPEPRRVPADFVAARAQRDPQSYLNVYLTGDYRNEANWAGEAIRGIDGIRMNWYYLPYAPELRPIVDPHIDVRALAQLFGQGDTLVHLVGHYLGLADTFNDLSRGELDLQPPWERCQKSDDFVADTAVHLESREPPSLPHVSATALEGACRRRDTCKAFPGLDPIENFMADMSDGCALAFTAGQVDRMENMVATFRRGFVVAAP